MINGKTKVLGIIGDPIGHTLSPEIHRVLAKACQQNTVYVPFHVTPEALSQAMAGVRAMNLLGFNVTVPHKKSVMAYLDECTEEAREMGAVNSVRNQEGKLLGHNTDALGWIRSVEREGVYLSGIRAVLFGAGGAAYGIGTALVKSGAKEIFVVNRTKEKGEALAAHLREKGGCAFAASLLDLTDIDLAVNTTNLGMIPNENQAITQDFSFMKAGGTVCDAVYAPRETLFLKSAKEAGLKTLGGIGMLIEQAVLSYEFFTGEKVPEAAIQELYRMLSFSQNIALCGFMGSGKSTVGKCLAKSYSLSFVDTDQMIEAQEKMTIPEIFAKKGEAYFRRAETEVIRALSHERGKVISLGGGAVLSEENRKILKETGQLIHLGVSAETVIKRVGTASNRPLLSGKSEEEIRALLDARSSAYRDAPAHIATDGKSPEEIVTEIVETVLTKR